MTRKSKGWLTGVGIFTALLFGTLAYISYRAYVVRGENYYLASVAVYGGVAIFSVGAVIAGWFTRLPGQRRLHEPPLEARGGDDPAPRV